MTAPRDPKVDCKLAIMEAYTLATFHPPRENSHSVNRPTDVSETNTAQNTPVSRQPRCKASHHANGIWISQKNTTLTRSA